MEITQIKLYELLKSKIGEKETGAFVYIIEEKMDTKFDQRKHELATKEDIYRLKEYMLEMRAELTRTIYVTSLGQLIAIVASVISFVVLFIKK